MWDVLSGVAKNGMGCFVPGCFVLHSILANTQNPFECLKARVVLSQLGLKKMMKYRLVQMQIKSSYVI